MDPLDEMTSGELGQLFPVIISDPDPGWVQMYREEEILIRKALGGDQIVRLIHIGSTAVPGLKAKPTIDILLEVPEGIDLDHLTDKLNGLGFHLIPKPENPAPHMMFVKGYTQNGFSGQAFHIHVRYPGDWDEPLFRDYLIAHPETAREYEKLKLRLAETFPNDREAYTEGKTSFVRKVMELLKGNRAWSIEHEVWSTPEV